MSLCISYHNYEMGYYIPLLSLVPKILSFESIYFSINNIVYVFFIFNIIKYIKI